MPLPKTYADPTALAEIERVEPLRKELATLQVGDVVRNINGEAHVVIDNNNGRPIAMRTISVTNPYEWTIVKRHDWGK